MRFLKHFIKTNIYIHIANWVGYFFYFKEVVYFPKNSLLFRRALHEGIYEESNISTIKKFVKQNTVVLDIGANIGLMAIPILKHNIDCEVWSFEPSPNSFKYLERTRNKMLLKNKWKLFNIGLSDKIGIETFFIAPPESGAFDSILNTSRTNFISQIQINVTTIDEIWQEAKNPDVSVIKIDIEGSDLFALQGGIECIKRCRPIILMEWNSNNIKPFGIQNDDLLQFCMKINYICIALPNHNLVADSNYLNMIMTTTEDFLLAPI